MQGRASLEPIPSTISVNEGEEQRVPGSNDLVERPWHNYGKPVKPGTPDASTRGSQVLHLTFW